jgi:hypothetical protein
MDLVYGEKLQKPRTLLPHSTILKLKRALHLRNGETELKTYEQFRLFMPAIEKALAEARAYLKRRGLEQTPEFQKHLISNERLGTGVNYRVRAYIGGQNIKDCDPLVGFASNQKFFRVELPLLIAAILTKDGEQLKIVRLTFVDGD